MARRSLRRIAPPDRGEVVRMWCALFAAQQAAGGLGGQDLRADRLAVEVETWVDGLIRGEGQFGLVAAQGPAVLGFIAVAQNWHPWLRPPRSATIAALWVEPGVRRAGLGQRLVIAAQRRLAQDGIDIVELRALPSPHGAGLFWQRQGFVPTTTTMQRRIALERGRA